MRRRFHGYAAKWMYYLDGSMMYLKEWLNFFSLARLNKVVAMSCIFRGFFLLFYLSITFQICPAQRSESTSLGLTPRAVDAFQHGNEAMQAQRFNEAATDFTLATRNAPKFAEGFLNLGIAQERTGSLNEAAISLARAIQLKPRLVGAHFVLGIVDYQLDRFDEAQAALQQETKVAPQNAQAWLWGGVSALDAGRPEQAAPLLEKAHSLEPKNIDVLYHLGRAYLMLSQSTYQQMFKLDPDSARVHEVLAQADVESSQSAAAIPEYKMAIQKSPMSPGLHEELADQYWIAGKFDEAEEAYRRELEIQPSNAIALFKLGSLQVQHQKATEGVPLLRKALAVDPQLFDVYYDLGLGQTELGDIDGAITSFKRATQVDPDSANRQAAYYRLFQLYHQSGHNDEAKSALATFIQMRTTSAAAQQQRMLEKRRRQSLPVQEDPNRLQP